MAFDPLKHVVYVFGVHPHDTRDEIHHTLLGKLWLKDGKFSVLEDHGIAGRHDLSKLPLDKVDRVLRRAMNSQRRLVCTGHDLKTGAYPELLPRAGHTNEIPSDLGEALHGQITEKANGPKVSEFEYHRTGMPGPQTLKVSGSQMYLDDQALAPEESQRVMEHLKSGKALIRHSMKKAEDLAKIEPHLAVALGQIRDAVKQGHVHPDALRTVNQTLFTDTMIPSIGNKAAYNDFLTRPREGVHVHLDGNDFGSINKMHDHETGNRAIIAMGRALRSAMDESVGRKNGKLFRTGGDEFVAHVPSHEHAALFARSLRSKLEGVPAIRGTHRLSMSLGFGPTHDHAEEALKDAKAAKKAANAPLGQAKTHAASRMPGREGLIPVD
jgi:GGDEF domain-containing protein